MRIMVLSSFFNQTVQLAETITLYDSFFFLVIMCFCMWFLSDQKISNDLSWSEWILTSFAQLGSMKTRKIPKSFIHWMLHYPPEIRLQFSSFFLETLQQDILLLIVTKILNFNIWCKSNPQIDVWMKLIV